MLDSAQWSHGMKKERHKTDVKPEVHNVSQRHQRRMRTEPWPLATDTKIGEVWPYGFKVMGVDRQTNKQTDIFITIPVPHNLHRSKINILITYR